MSLINPLAREISAKVVYYGPGLSGKTTSLKYVHESVRPERRGQLLTLATEGDRTIFFDFLPLQVRQVQGMGVRFQLYTVPGQVFYEATRRLVLNGADGVVFVADSQRQARDSNLHSFENLLASLEDMGIDVARFPLVFSYNKRDLPDLMPVEMLRADLNRYGAPEIETCAASGVGVLDALKEVSGLVLRALWADLPKGAPRPTSFDDDESAAPAAPRPASQLAPPGGGGIEAELLRVASLSPPRSVPPHETPYEEVAEVAEPRTHVPPPVVSPDLGLSFTALWEGMDAVPVADVEAAIRDGAWERAIEGAARALASLLESLPGTLANESPMAKAALLGLDGLEYLRFCRLVTLPERAVSEKDALFALYMLISAKLKAHRL